MQPLVRRRGVLRLLADLRPSCGRRGHVTIAATLVLTALGGTRAAAQRLEIAIAHTDSAGTLCLRREAALPPGTRVWLVQPDTPQSVAEALPAVGRCRQRRSDAPESLVPLRVVGGALDSMRLGIAIVGARAAPVLRRGVASVDLDGDGTPERFRACTSSEGVHLTIWSGRPLTGRLRWHGYYYLGYDVEPSCTAAEARDPAPGAALVGARPRPR